MEDVSRREDVNFDRVASVYDATRGGVARARASARDVAPHLPAGDVLEIGVGTGIVAEALREAAPQVRRLAGADISAEMLRRARERLPGRVVRASASRLPFPGGRFDGILAVHVLHLVSDLTATLAEAARVLRPGGRLVASHAGPQHTEDDDELQAATRGLQDLGDSRPDSPEVVRASAEQAGLRVATQHLATPRITQHSPAELADLIESRTWSRLWTVDETQWRTHVEPVLAALRALPDQHRPRRQEARMTVSVLVRP